jgi:hypothetical protein
MRSGVRVAGRDVSFSLLPRERALKESTKFRARFSIFSIALSFLLVMTMSDFCSPGYIFLREIKWL